MSIENHNSMDGAEAGDELLLSRYLEGRLEGAQKQAVEELLRSSAAARRRLDALREEEKLLREALETLSEPSKRLGDKVIAALHNDERARLASLRSRRLRRNVFAVMSAAATIVLCVWLVRPRDSMGTVASGTPATLVTPIGERKSLTKETKIYEGDELIAGRSQFVRLQLSGDGVLDIDENSRLEFQKHEPATLSLESGRVGLAVPEGAGGVTVRLPQGSVRAPAGALVDIWLPQPASALWPELLELLPSGSTRGGDAPAAKLPAVITVLSGSAVVSNEKMRNGVSISAGNRVLLMLNERHRAHKVDMAGSRVLEMRRGRSWHALDNVSPHDRTVIGLLEKQNFAELGERLGLTRNTGKEVSDALKAVQGASQTADAYLRAEKLAAAQQQLRLAYEALEAGDERRPFGRMLEGLAHMERGRALVAVSGSNDNITAANAAFDAARVAFEEALRMNADATPAPAAGKPDWAAAIAAGSSVTLRDMSPANQSSLLASFHHALARHWMAKTARVSAADLSQALAVNGVSIEAAKEFDALRGELGRSVEAMAARLAEGLALKEAGRNGKAIEALEEVLAISPAGMSESARRHADGIRQTALVAFVKLYVEAREIQKAQTAEQDFWLLFPLENSSNSPACREIQRLLNDKQSEQAAKALEDGNHAKVVEIFDAWPGRVKTAVTEIQLLRAVVALKNGDRARQIVHELEGLMTEEQRQEHQALLEQAKALPVSAPVKEPSLLPVR